MLFHILGLIVSAALALWMAARVARATGGGAGQFVWLAVAIAVWCVGGVGHAAASTVEAKLLWARFQYFGIASVAPWFLLFMAEYAGARWFTAGPGARVP